MLLRSVLKLVPRNDPGVIIVFAECQAPTRFSAWRGWRASSGTASGSDLRHAPVDNEIDGRRETTVVRGEIEGRSRDLLRKPEASQRNQRDEEVRQLLRNLGEGRRVTDRSRTNAVHPDLSVLQVVRPAS